MPMLGIIFAAISSVFFGLYIIPRKLSKLPAIQFSTLMALGFSVGSALLYLLVMFFQKNETLKDADLWYAVFAGILWATALVLLVKSIDVIGLARSNQWKNLQGPIGVILALVVLNEYISVNVYFATGSGLAIFASALLFSIRSEDSVKVDRMGILLAVMSGVLFGTVSLINKYVTDNAGIYSQQVVWSLSILGSLLAYQSLTGKFTKKLLKVNKEVAIGVGSGLLYLGASVFMLLAFSQIEASIAFTIIQMNFLVVILLGIFAFKEFRFKGNEFRILSGLMFAILGIILLSLAR
jgi:glucose uptake protein GlcU